jgi:hypothetical protein
LARGRARASETAAPRSMAATSMCGCAGDALRARRAAAGGPTVRSSARPTSSAVSQVTRSPTPTAPGPRLNVKAVPAQPHVPPNLTVVTALHHGQTSLTDHPRPTSGCACIPRNHVDLCVQAHEPIEQLASALPVGAGRIHGPAGQRACRRERRNPSSDRQGRGRPGTARTVAAPAAMACAHRTCTAVPYARTHRTNGRSAFQGNHRRLKGA